MMPPIATVELKYQRSAAVAFYMFGRPRENLGCRGRKRSLYYLRKLETNP